MMVTVKVRGETQILLSPEEFQERARLARERWLAEREAAVERTQQGGLSRAPARVQLAVL